MSIADRICRTCGKTSELDNDSKLFPLYKSVDYVAELKVILEELETWELNISQNDGLPQQICMTCFDSFCQIHNFRVTCIEAQMSFGEMCTGLDIIIEEKITNEDFDGEELVTVQEHYTFPGDKCLKSIVHTLSPDLPDTIKNIPDSDKKDTIQNGQLDVLKDKNNDHPDVKEYRCEYCMETVIFDDPDQLNKHFNYLHSTNLPYTCPECDKCFDKKAKRNSHARTHKQIVGNCEICGKKVRGGNKAMAQHIEYSHVEEDRECVTCGKKFEMISLNRFNYHMSWHDDSKLHKCHYCDKKFIQTTHLTVHERTHTGEHPFKCKECGMAFKNPNLLNNHIKNHGKREIQCSKCPKKFFHRHALGMHMKVHNIDKKYLHCEICDITYKSLLNLQMHSYKKHNAPATPQILNVLKRDKMKHPLIKPFKCAQCPEAFVLHTQLVKHSKIHTEDRPHACDICFKAFKRLSHMKYHRDSMHFNKKPHKCTLCGWAFPQLNNLKEHFAAKHDGSKDFKCKICPKEFATVKSLKSHMVTHSDKKPFVCTVCNKSFKQLFVLRTHMSRHLRKNEANIRGGDITDMIVEEELEDDKSQVLKKICINPL